MAAFENIFVEGTGKSPHVDFNKFTGDLILSGRSIPENAAKVYEPLFNWIKEYILSPRPTTNLRLNLEYFNTATSIWLAKLVSVLSKIDRKDHSIFIHLYFDIEDFDDLDNEDLKDIVGSLLDNIGKVKVSIAVKTYGTDPDGKILKTSTILI